MGSTLRSVNFVLLLLGILSGVVFVCKPVLAEGDSSGVRSDAFRTRFTVTVRPFLKKYCLGCHGAEEAEAKFQLSGFTSLESVVDDLGHWRLVLERLHAEEMPPTDADHQPTRSERQVVVEWIEALRSHEAERRRGDPGAVLARRLSNAEYDYSIRDLTGVDLRPTREFPVDPANEAGFDNSGESLGMSPTLLSKYLRAARSVAEHVVLTPVGLDFAPHPVVSVQDREKYCVHRIVNFYAEHSLDYADYFLGAWRFHHRVALGHPQATLADIAHDSNLSSKYLSRVWLMLQAKRHGDDPLATVLSMWRALPEPDGELPEIARPGCAFLRDFVLRERQRLVGPEPSVGLFGISVASQTLILWKNRQIAARRMSYYGASKTTNDPAQRERDAALSVFCATFPDVFYVSERGRMYLPLEQRNKGRLLNAGFHLMGGFFRDDTPLYELVLDEKEQRRLDTLWDELNFITAAPMRQYRDFIFFERAEPLWFMKEKRFDFARAEDVDVTSQEKIQRLATKYLEKARNQPNKHVPPEENEGEDLESGTKGQRQIALQAIEDYFRNIGAEILWVEQAWKAAESIHLDALAALAERAYRRPLEDFEHHELRDFYRMRRDEGLEHVEAVRDALVSVLMSPHFCYRVDLPQAGVEPHPLSQYSLASRLSYFLWSSLPDEELLACAATATLHQPEVLVAQARRMLRDPKVSGLVTEFAGNWLDFRRFKEHNSVDRERFANFTDDLRQAMFEEPVRFLLDLIQRNGSLLELLYGQHTFVNPLLAAHYGIPVPPIGPHQWLRVDDARSYGRGGLLPMSVFLTKNSPGLRTSPVKRGYWVVRRLLGQHISPPPPDVPELPADEAELGDVTLREALAKHREIESCAGCHKHFDSFGLVFEGYGPIGERRTTDFNGRAVDTRATFPNGLEGHGVDGLRSYLRVHRQQDFIDHICRKLFSYALGRGLLLSDESTIAAFHTRLATDEHRFAGLVEAIVTSPQFRNQRGRDHGTRAPSEANNR